MSAKRQATSDLNHDNWDRDEEPEDKGTFRTATDDELKHRVIKKARRTVPSGSAASTDAADVTKSVFSGFAGFGKAAAAAPATTATPFSFLSKIPAVAASSAGGEATTTATTSSTPTFSFGNALSSTTAKTAPAIPLGEAPIKPKDGEAALEKSADKSNEYYAKLKGLNRAVSEWIKTHVDKNPLCLLTPIFKDYENYLKEIEREHDSKASSTASTSSTASSASLVDSKPATSLSSFKFVPSASTAAATTASASSAATFSFPFTPASSATGVRASAESAPKTNGFSFGLKKPEEPKAAVSSAFTFGLQQPPTTSSVTPSTNVGFGKAGSTDAADGGPKPSAGFTFAPGTAPFSFGNIKPPPTAAAAAAATESAAGAEEDDEEDQPPKVEFKQVVEEDAVYSKRCKVFVKKDGNFVDRGIGTLYLKPVEASGKTQMLVRAETNLGNILVNLILSAGIPVQRMGKNNVMLVCLPTPDVEKPTSLLLRVKTGEEADELTETIEKYKK